MSKKLTGDAAHAAWIRCGEISDDDVFVPMRAAKFVDGSRIAWKEGDAYHAVSDPTVDDVRDAVERMQAAIAKLIVQYVCEEMLDIKMEDEA